MDEQIYKPFDTIILRTPLMSLEWMEILFEKKDFNEILNRYFENELLQEAIFLASPNLYERLKEIQYKREDVEKLTIALAKYFLRLSTRCTPFGLFAGCSTLNVGNETKIKISNDLERHTRLDMLYLNNFCLNLSKHNSIKAYINYFPNNSIYKIRDQIRFVEYKFDEKNKKTHQLVGLEGNDIIDFILFQAKNGKSVYTLIEDLLSVDETLPRDGIEKFIWELIDGQLLVSELEPSITGGEMQSKLIKLLECILFRIKDKKDRIVVLGLISQLEIIDKKIKLLDKKNTKHSVEAYADITLEIEKLGVSVDKKYLFQIDLKNNLIEDKLEGKVLNDVLKGLDILSRFSPLKKDEDESHKNLERFKEEFLKRYEGEEIPLVEALDKELGVNYSLNAFDEGTVSTLVDDLQLPAVERSTSEVDWDDRTHKFWLKKFLESRESENLEVTISDEEIEKFKSRMIDCPDTLALIVSLIKNQDSENDYQIIFRGGGSPNASRMLGRFCYLDEGIHKVVKEITDREQVLQEDHLIAEICHLPESRAGNILLRPILSEYEISYLGKVGVKKEYEILVTDLMLSVKNGKIILRSKNLDKVIIPRLSSAHNYSYNALPIYKFLCDLQYQHTDLPSPFLNFGVLSSNLDFVPRVRYKNLILNRATWIIERKDFSFLTSCKEEEIKDVFGKFCAKNKFPKSICLVVGDNQLVIDTENILSAKIFIKEIKRMEKIVICEYFQSSQNAIVKNNLDEGVSNELIVPLYKQKGNDFYKKNHQEIVAERTFPLGSKWVYFKIYTGVKTADKLLVSYLKPLIDEFVEEKLIDKWFFLRFGDPDFHLRIRIELSEVEHVQKIVAKIYQSLKALIDSREIWDLKFDTYKRELERYGDKFTTYAESIFYQDSQFFMEVLSLIDSNYLGSSRWLFSVLSIDDYLSSMGLPIEEKLEVINDFRNQFALEFNEDKSLKNQLSMKFRSLRKEIYPNLIERIRLQKIHPDLFLLFENRKDKLTETFEKMRLDGASDSMLKHWLGSYTHMHINRFFKSKQRLHEYVIYDLLSRSYKESIARNKFSKKQLTS